MTNALAALINAAPQHLDRLGVTPSRAVASVDGAKFDNRPTWDNRGSFDGAPAGTNR